MVRTGILIDDRGRALDDVVGRVRAAAAAGFASAWVGQHFAVDPLQALALAAREAPGIELGTGVVVTHAQHPLTLASQALTARAAAGARLTLGLGVSNRTVVEGMLGGASARPARHMREYLSALLPLLGGERVSYRGETLGAEGAVAMPGAAAPSVLISAHRPLMLALGGALADGVLTNWAGPAALDGHIVPAVRAAAREAGRPGAPRIVAMVLACVTAEEEARRAWVAETFAVSATDPGYRTTLDQSGASGPEDVVLVGDEASVERQVRRLGDAGATEVVAMPFGSPEEQARTFDVLAASAGLRDPGARG